MIGLEFTTAIVIALPFWRTRCLELPLGQDCLANYPGSVVHQEPLHLLFGLGQLRTTLQCLERH